MIEETGGSLNEKSKGEFFMPTKIDEALTAHMEHAAKEDPQKEISVILTVKEGADHTALEKKGLRIHHTFEAISAVAGTATLQEIETLAELDEVVSIEFDGEMRASEPHR